MLMPASACAAWVAGLASAPAPPRAGVWRIVSGGARDNDLSGSLTISSGRRISSLHGTIERDAQASCGAGTVTVTSGERIIDATGTSPEGKGYNEWVVGVNEPDASPVVQPTRVQLIVRRRRLTGLLDLVFSGLRGESRGDIYYAGGNCDLYFLVERLSVQPR
jgi:hypothetical protein